MKVNTKTIGIGNCELSVNNYAICKRRTPWIDESRNEITNGPKYGEKVFIRSIPRSGHIQLRGYSSKYYDILCFPSSYFIIIDNVSKEQNDKGLSLAKINLMEKPGKKTNMDAKLRLSNYDLAINIVNRNRDTV